MNKKYVVRLSNEERVVCQDVVKTLQGTSQKVKRAQMLLKADIEGLGVVGCEDRRGLWWRGADGRVVASAAGDGGLGWRSYSWNWRVARRGFDRRPTPRPPNLFACLFAGAKPAETYNRGFSGLTGVSGDPLTFTFRWNTLSPQVA